LGVAEKTDEASKMNKSSVQMVDDFVSAASKLFGCKKLVFEKERNRVRVCSGDGKIYGTSMKDLLDLASRMGFLCYVNFADGSVVFYPML
jgi:precorrin-4 methylase